MTGLVWVYVDVVCDLFHRGHIEFLRKARAMGDRLVVGVLSDADAMSYKPAPILSFEERCDVLRGCRYVDRVLEAPAPLHCTPEFLDEIGAAFCVHGDDQNQEELTFFYRALMPVGRLRIVGYTAGVSSRDIISRIIERYEAGTLRIRPKPR